MKGIKYYWKRFRAWQRRGYVPPLMEHAVLHECVNCGEQYTGYHCPRCGQPAGTMRFTMRNAMIHTMEVWGVGNSTFLRTIGHLLTRPGYMIADYLRGHRQPYFPAVRMLFITVAIFIIVSMVLPQHGTPPEQIPYTEVARNAAHDDNLSETDATKGQIAAEGILGAVDTIMAWKDRNVALWLLCYHTMLALFTTWIFKRSPRMPAMTIVENFYSQAYICTQLLWVQLLYTLCTFMWRYHIVSEPNELVASVIYVIDYKMLYGFKWWGTVWRTIATQLCIALAYCLMWAIVLFVTGFYVAMQIAQ